MRLRLTLLLLCLALPAYATDTALVDHDGVTQPLVLTPANLGVATAAQGALADAAQPDVKGVAGLDIFQNSTGARFPYIDFHSNDTYPDYTARIAQWDSGALQFFNNNPMTGYGTAFSFEGPGTFRVKQSQMLQRVTAPSDAWTMYPASEHSIEFPYLGVGSATQGFASWLVSAGPTPAQVTAHGNGSSWGILGEEINTFERFADQGYKETRSGRWSGALQIVPESELNIFGSTQRGYNGNFGIIFGHSWGVEDDPANRTYTRSKWHVPLMFEDDTTTPAGTTVLFKGGSAVGTQANKTIKAIGYHNDVIDTSGATVAGSVLKVAPAQTFSDGTVTKTLAQLAAGPFTASGNTTIAATVSGAKTAGKQLTYDASGNVIVSAYDVGATGGGGGTVTGVTATAPVESSGGTAPVISMAAATDSVNGYLTSADHTTFAAKAPSTPSYVALGTDSGLANERVLTGTTNQITVTDGGAGGNVTLSLPQAINTAATPRFGGLNINGAMGAGAGEIKAYGSAPMLWLQNSTTGSGLSWIDQSGQQMIMTKTSPSGSQAFLDFNGSPADGTSNVYYRYGRNTNTTGVHAVQVLKGNNSSTANAQIGGNTDTYFAADNGKVGIGTSTPAAGYMLDVNGSIKTNESVLETPYANGTCTTSVNLNAKYGIQTLTLSGACQIGVTNLAAGRSFTLKLTQSSTTAPTFTSAYKWPSATAPTWSTAATKYDVLSCYSDDGSTLLCNGMVDVR